MIEIMTSSMTAFSRQSSQSDSATLVWELRTVNHRFLDISIRLPDSLRALEPAVREQLRSKLQRGKVEASLRVIPGPQLAESLKINEGLVQQLAMASDQIRQYFPQHKPTYSVCWLGQA